MTGMTRGRTSSSRGAVRSGRTWPATVTDGTLKVGTGGTITGPVVLAGPGAGLDVGNSDQTITDFGGASDSDLAIGSGTLTR